jgi:hypothetical protein
MRVFAIHDALGNISEVVTSPEDAPRPVLTTRPGLTMTEIEVPASLVDDLEFPETVAEVPEGVTRLAERFQVQVAPAGTAALVERGPDRGSSGRDAAY